MRMTQPAYPAARAAAIRVHPLYAQHLARTRVEGERKIDLLPDVETIEVIVDVAFWASLRREENLYTTNVSRICRASAAGYVPGLSWYAHLGSGTTPILRDRLPLRRPISLARAACGSPPSTGATSRIMPMPPTVQYTSSV